jgi:hypothetical protein
VKVLNPDMVAGVNREKIMNRVITTVVLAAFVGADLGSAELLFAQHTERPTMPRILHGYCEGEDQCAHTVGAHLMACEPLVLRGDAQIKAALVQKVRRGDRLRVTDATTRVVAPGIVVARRAIVVTDEWGDDQGRVPRRDTVRMTVADTPYLLEYGELGTWTWRYPTNRNDEPKRRTETTNRNDESKRRIETTNRNDESKQRSKKARA